MTSDNQSINALPNLLISPDAIEAFQNCALQVSIAAGRACENLQEIAHQYGIPLTDAISFTPAETVVEYFESDADAKCLIAVWKYRSTVNRLINEASDASQPAYLIDSLVQSRIKLEEYYDCLFYRIKKASGFNRHEIEEYLGALG